MFAKGRVALWKEDITNVIPEAEILGYYLGISKIPCVINSPLRPDTKPSLGFFTRDGVEIVYQDFSTGETGTTFMLLGQLFKLSQEETLKKIYNELVLKRILNTTKVDISERSRNRVTFSNGTEIDCKVRNWKKHDIDYWEQYGISLEWLKFSNTYPISHILVTKDKFTKTFLAEKYAYAYVEFKDGKTTLKIYQPFSETFKWTNKHDSSVWDLWQQLPKEGDNLIITSSRKDALCIWENTGIPACSLQAESYFPKEQVVDELKSRFKNIYILYDNDFNKEKNYGALYSKALSEKFNLIQITIPNEFRVKDTSDLCKEYGREQVKQTISKLII